MNEKSLYGMIQGNLGLIFLQYLIGSYISLFINIGQKTNLMDYFSSYPSVALHAFLAVIILLMAIVIIVFSRGKKGIIMGGAIVSFLGVIISIIGGIGFLNNDLSAGYSFIMSVGFIISVGGYLEAIIGFLRNKN